MSAETNVQTVQAVFGAFGRGDIPGVLEHISDEAEWVMPGPETIPYAGTRRGKAGAAEFFTHLGGSLEMERFDVEEFVAQGDKVVVLGSERFTSKATGRACENDWALVFTLRDGQIVRYQAYEDTAALAAAFG